MCEGYFIRIIVTYVILTLLVVCIIVVYPTPSNWNDRCRQQCAMVFVLPILALDSNINSYN